MKDNINHNPPLPDDRAGKVQPFGEVIGRLMNEPAYHGIPTLYRGIQFRSRLEAKWAAFFDQLSWPWIYEPMDLPGWIPDFLLGQYVLVEVKPFSSFEQFEDAISKAERAMTEAKEIRDLLLLGLSPIEGEFLGWLGETIEYMSYRRRISGYYDGSYIYGHKECAESHWAAASNATQWRPPHGR